MKKSKLLILSLCSLFVLAACEKKDNKKDETPTAIEIVGAYSVLVNKTINLTADVIGSSNDEVTWSSSDTTIATVSESGTVKGISAGTVTIMATCVQDSSITATFEIEVMLPKADSIKIVVEENEGISYNEITKRYSVPVGKPFYLETVVVPDNTRIPDISYALIYEDGSTYNPLINVESVSTTRAKVVANAVISNMTIKATGKYDMLGNGDMITSIQVDVIDNNAEAYANTNAIISSFMETEQQNLISSDFYRKHSITNNSSNTSISYEYNIKHKSYNNASYLNVEEKTYTGSNLTDSRNINYYQGIDTIDSSEYYYCFTYNSTSKVIEKFHKTGVNKDYAGMMFDPQENGVTYGYTNLIYNILNSQTNIYDGSIVPFYDSLVYAYSTFELMTGQIKVVSHCIDDNTNTTYDLELIVKYADTHIISYEFDTTITNSLQTINYYEKANNLLYGSKLDDNLSNNEDYLDLSKYYIEDFSVQQIVVDTDKNKESYDDFKNPNKYGALESKQTITIIEDGQSVEKEVTKYTLSYDKTLALKINVNSPNTGNVYFDNITASSSDEQQIPNISKIGVGSDIFTIVAKKDDNSLSQPGIATFTFATTKGVKEYIVVEFIEAMLEEVFVTLTNEENLNYNESTKTYTLNSIFEGDYSDYFFINTTPDEDKYSFYIDVIEGDKTGISLYKWADGNVYSYPGFSYSIYGNKAGTYKFKVGVEGYENIFDENTYEITIKQPLTKEFIASNIVGTSYVYKGSISEYTFTFTSETELTYTETSAVTDTLTVTIPYVIEDGKIYIANETPLSDPNNSNPDVTMYFSKIAAGAIIFEEDFSSMQFKLHEASSTIENSYQLYTFTKVKEKVEVENLYDYVNGKTFEIGAPVDYRIDGGTMQQSFGTVTLSFNNGTGSITLVNQDGLEVVKITFNYTYDSTTKDLVYSNITISNSIYFFITSSSYFDVYNQQIVIKIEMDSGFGWNSASVFKFSL